MDFDAADFDLGLDFGFFSVFGFGLDDFPSGRRCIINTIPCTITSQLLAVAQLASTLDQAGGRHLPAAKLMDPRIGNDSNEIVHDRRHSAAQRLIRMCVAVLLAVNEVLQWSLANVPASGVPECRADRMLLRRRLGRAS